MPAINSRPSPPRFIVMALAMLGLGSSCGVAPAGASEGGKDGGSPFESEGVEVELSDGTLIQHPVTLVQFDNDRGENLQGVLIRPDNDSTPVPAVVILHGSGGLFSTPDSNDTELEVGKQFGDWAALLAARGYAVLLPSSFYSRGYLEWADRPEPKLDKLERIIMRVHDAYGALRYLCEQPFIDCDRVGSMGFSNGGSVAMLAQYEGLDQLSELGPLTPVAQRDRFIITTAYYPGCGLQDLISDGYFPSAPVQVNHASEDSLLEHCPERVEESGEIAQARGLTVNPTALTIYEGADHGFDGDPDNGAEERARDEARSRTLERFEATLQP